MFRALRNVSLVSVIIFTVIEVIALAIWLRLQMSVGPGLVYLGLVILATGLIFEHLFTYNFVLYSAQSSQVSDAAVRRNIVTFSIVETAIWAVWLLLANQGQGQAITAFAFLLGGLIIEHTLTDNVFKGRALLSRLVDARVIPHSIVETVAATAWLQLVQDERAIVGIGVLFVGSLVEHLIAVAVSRS